MFMNEKTDEESNFSPKQSKKSSGRGHFANYREVVNSNEEFRNNFLLVTK